MKVEELTRVSGVEGGGPTFWNISGGATEELTLVVCVRLEDVRLDECVCVRVDGARVELLLTLGKIT